MAQQEGPLSSPAEASPDSGKKTTIPGTLEPALWKNMQV